MAKRKTAPPKAESDGEPSKDARPEKPPRPARDVRLTSRMRAALASYGLDAREGLLHACCAAAKAVLVDDED